MTYEEFSQHRPASMPPRCVHIHQKNMDIGGGKVAIEEIDQLEACGEIDDVMISGLRQDTFEYFIRKYAHRYKHIHFFKNKAIRDLSPLATLDQVVLLSFFHNQQATALWDMSGNKCLAGLVLNDFTKLHTLEGVQTAPVLRHLRFGDLIESASTLTDIQPLPHTRLESFSFGGKAIFDPDISIYWHIPTLRYLDFAPNAYTTEDIARIVAHCPHLQGHSLRPYIPVSAELLLPKDTLICGKRKPLLASSTDAARIRRYVEQFERLVQQYRAE